MKKKVSLIINTKPMGFGKLYQSTVECEVDCLCDNCGNEWTETTEEFLYWNEIRLYEQCSFCINFKNP